MIYIFLIGLFWKPSINQSIITNKHSLIGNDRSNKTLEIIIILEIDEIKIPVTLNAILGGGTCAAGQSGSIVGNRNHTKTCVVGTIDQFNTCANPTFFLSLLCNCCTPCLFSPHPFSF